MTEREQAADHLKVIRSLMERATVYRTISWPTALFGGALAVLLAAVLFLREKAGADDGTLGEKRISEADWVICWMVALVLTVLFNFWLVSRKSKREGRPFFSPGLKMALRGVVPPMLAGGVLGIILTLKAEAAAAAGASVWVTCYGLALLATRGLAPTSIPRLELAFLMAGLAAFLYSWISKMGSESLMLEANLIMGICFGLFHLVYGVIVMRNSRREGGAAGVEGA